MTLRSPTPPPEAEPGIPSHEPSAARALSPFWIWGSMLAALAVLLGAFGAHGLEKAPSVVQEPSLLDTWETAARYHLIHALGLVAVALHPRQPRLPGFLFLAGILLFSGSLYTLVLSGMRWLGALTPLGGLALTAGWAALAWASRPRGQR